MSLAKSLFLSGNMRIKKKSEVHITVLSEIFSKIAGERDKNKNILGGKKTKI